MVKAFITVVDLYGMLGSHDEKKTNGMELCCLGSKRFTAKLGQQNPPLLSPRLHVDNI
jgi:hypothetical protein